MLYDSKNKGFWSYLCESLPCSCRYNDVHLQDELSNKHQKLFQSENNTYWNFIRSV